MSRDTSSLDHLIRPPQHIRRNSQADLLGCFEIDNELEFRRLLDRKSAGLAPFKNLVHIRSCAAVQVSKATP